MKTVLTFFLCLQFTFVVAQESYHADAVAQFQQELNAQYSNPEKSPLTAQDRAVFKSLEFFPANPTYFVTAKLVRTPSEQPFLMKTSTDRKPTYIKYGEVYFTMDGQGFKLNVYQNIELSKQKEYVNYLFLPFSDVTSGDESYLGGRYIDLKIPEGDLITIDFNKAYNPYCAYNSDYSCPLVPLENDLNVAIKAGVKKFHE